MTLSELNLKFKYRSDLHNIQKDFYEPCLANSTAFDRAAGYFTSGSLQVLAKGMSTFLQKGGKIRVIANPYLNKSDIEAIRLGHKAREDIIIKAILKEIEISEKSLHDETLNVLAWLIYQKQLEIKIAYADNGSLYHEKFGLFYDETGHTIAFSGSANETVGGLMNNFENINVFSTEQDKFRIFDMKQDFDALWKNETSGLTIMTFPDAAVEKVLANRKGAAPPIHIRKPDPRPYQRIAIQAIQGNSWNGILEMATGTGKTITSLLIAEAFRKQHDRLFLVIIVPYTHLVEQWESECNRFGIDEITLCYGSRKSWVDKLHTEIRDFNAGFSAGHTIITTYKTASTAHFNRLVDDLSTLSMLIADECHNFGVKTMQNNKMGAIQSKVGLSATPQRWWDEAGSNYLHQFFGGTVYEYSMEEAIRNKALTEYQYNPVLIDLTEEEIEAYEKLTKRIVYLYNSDQDNTEDIERLQLERSLIIARANNKVDALVGHIKETGIDNVEHTLVYCAPGQVTDLTRLLSDLGLRVHQFDSTIRNAERSSILQAFVDGVIQVLIAIKCLDEGVDVPSTRVAYFLSSTSNPREFIQRRGRVLRRFKDKTMAVIYDSIVLPESANSETFETIASKELPRFAEFSAHAINKYAARKEVSQVLEAHHLEHLMDKLPWEVYHELQKREEGE